MMEYPESNHWLQARPDFALLLIPGQWPGVPEPLGRGPTVALVNLNDPPP